jgi:hypothetical protein
MEIAELFNYYLKGIGTAHLILSDLKSPDAIYNQLCASIMEHAILLDVIQKAGMGELIADAGQVYAEIKKNLDRLSAELHKRTAHTIQ